MLRCKKTVLSLLVTLVMTVAVIVLRVTLVPWAQGRDGFNLGYIVVGLMLLTVVALFVLLRWGREELPRLSVVKGKWLLPLSVTVIAVGGCILLNTIIDMYMWAAYGVTPPPGTAVTGSIDRATLFLSLILGVLSGIYFIRLGVMWVREDGESRGVFPLWALAPTFWIWMRLARYEVSYASAVEVHESFYDFAMLIVCMLFLLSFARHSADVNERKPHTTVFFALCTAFMSISGSLARVFLFLLGEGEVSRTGQLAGVSDFVVGVLAVVFVLYWLFGGQPAEEVFEPSPEEGNEAEEAPQDAEEGSDDADALPPEEQPIEEE